MTNARLKDSGSGAQKPPLSIGFNVPFNEAIAAANARGVVLPDVYYDELQAIARQKAFSIAGLASLDQLQAVKDSLDKAIASGQSFGAWKKQMLTTGTLDLPTHRLDNIFRTNLQGQYMAGKWEKFKVTAHDRPYLIYDAINDSRTRPAHMALDGIIRRIDDPFWLTHSPMCGYRCRCSLRTLSDSQAQARSQGENKGLNKRAVLPNGDPALPDAGWDYDKRGRMEGVKRAMRDKKVKAAPPLVEALEARVDDANKKQKARLQALDYVLSNGRALESDGIEFAFAYNEAGKTIVQRMGEKRAVSFSQKEAEDMRAAKGVVLVHNHPGGTSLSMADFKVAHAMKLSEIVAAGHNGAVYSGVMLNNKAFEAIYDGIDTDIYAFFWQKVDDETMTMESADFLHNHVLNLVLHGAGVVRYETNAIPELTLPSDVSEWISEKAVIYAKRARWHS